MNSNDPQAAAESVAPGRRPRRRARWPWVLGALVLVIALAGAGGWAWARNAGWSTQPPQVLGIAPPPGSRDVPGDTPISIAFDMPMNPDSVRSHVTIDPPTDGTFTWDGNTLLFHPAPGYRRGVTYTVQIGAGASSPLFQGLQQAVSTSFKTAGLPSLYRSVPPADAANVPTDTMVTLQFSGPMVALSSLDSQPDPGAQVHLQPDAGGHWQWLGSTTLAYRAATLRPATRYSVSVAKGLPDHAGSPLDQDYNFNFTTIRPAIIATTPETDTKFVGTSDPLVVTFNQPVDHPSAEAGFTLAPAANGAFAWAPDSTVFTYTLSSPLPEDTAIRATLTGVKPASGDLAQDGTYSWGFRTTPRPRVTDTQPADGDKAVTAGNQILVHYSAPISATNDELLAGIQFDPPVKGLGAYSYDDGATLNIFAPLAPSTGYTVTVGAGAGYRDRTGHAVPAYTWHFRTARTTPDARILSNDNLVSYYAGLPTHVFLRAVNVDSFLRMRLWKLGGDELAAYLQLPADKRAVYQPQTALVRTWDIPVTYKLDQPLSLNPAISLDGKGDRLPPGFYYLRVSTPQTANAPSTINGTAVVVGNAGLTMKMGTGEFWVWAVDMGTGKPLAGRTIRLANQDQAPVTATTDADGLAHATVTWDRYQGQPLALLEDGDAAVVSSAWSDSIGPWNFDLNIKDRKSNDGIALYTDRAIYSPGQTVYFKGIVRADDDGRYSVPGTPVDVTLQDNDGHTVYSATLPLSPFGTFAGQYDLPDYAPLGNYYLACKCNPDGGGPGASLAVQEYRKPEYLVGVTTDKQSYVNGESIKAVASAGYFFGGPVVGAGVTTRVLTQDYYFNWTDPSGGYYSFQDPDLYADRQNSFNGQKQSESQATSDAAGQVNLTLPADVSKMPLSQVETIEASVQDSANQTISSNTQVVVHKAQYYVGLRPTSYLATTGQPATVEVQTVADNGDRQPNAAVNLTFFRRVWEQTTEKDETGVDRPTWKPRDTPAGAVQVTTDAQGHAQAQFTPSDVGEYRVVADGRDAAGNPVHSATSVYVSNPNPAEAGAAIPWQQKNPSIVTLVADKASYTPGETAHILVTSPFSQAVGLLTVERGHVLSHRLVDLRGPAPVIDLPIDAGYLPNVYISLSMVQPAAPGRAPDFRQGYLALPVSAAAKQLVVMIKPSSTELHPRDTVTYTLTVRDAAGRPAQAELSLALVDKAIYSLAGDQTPTLMDSFYGVRSLDLTTASSFLVLADQATQAAPGGKGGGGGGGPDSFVRSQFADTAYWKAQVTTDANGQAIVAVRLPDNLTTWRLSALAVTKDTLVGQATNEVVATKPLLVRPQAPRFLVAGDTLQPAAIVENRTGCTPDVDVTLVLSGATFVANGPAATQHVHLGGETVVNWQITASQGPSATLTYMLGPATCNGAAVPGDSVQIALPVEAPLTTESVVTSGSVEPGGAATEHIFLPHGVDTTTGSVSLDVVSSLAAGAGQAVNYVTDEQYDSTEQTVSRFLPLLQLSKAYSAAGLSAPYSADVPGIVNRALVRLYRDQHYDGGWGWFDTAPSDPYLTAYALEGMTAARTAGYAVSQDVLDKAAQYLEDWLNTPPQDARLAQPRLDTRAYVLYALALQGHQHLDLARALAVRANSLALYGRAYLALAFQHLSAPDDANRLLTDLAGATKQTATTAHWEEAGQRTAEAYLDMDTDARTTALVLQGLLARDRNDPLIARGVRWLMENRRAGHWLSTQETATVLGTLAAYMLATGDLNGSGAWTATVNNAPWGSGGSAPTEATTLRRDITALLINQDNSLAITRQGGTGRLYYTLNLNYSLPGAAVTARSEGLSIVREYVQPGAGAPSQTVPPGTPLRQAAAGDLVEIRLTVIAPTDAYYVVVDDPLPAGLEAVNGTLQTTGLTERLNPPTAPVSDANGKGGDAGQQAATAQFFDNVEMRDDRTVLYASYLPAGVYEYRYLARATTAGTYTVLPAQAHLTYLPDVWGRTDSGQFTVTPK